jgi:SHS2 domain-containing protein
MAMTDLSSIDTVDKRPLMGHMSRTSAHWEHFSHSADIGVRGFGSTKQEAFAQTALAMVAVMVDPATVKEDEEVRLHWQESDVELLLLAWLNALVYEMDVRHMLFSRFEVKIEGDSLVAQAFGEKIDYARHQFQVEVKAATPSELKVGCDDQGRWVAQCIVDV